MSRLIRRIVTGVLSVIVGLGLWLSQAAAEVKVVVLPADYPRDRGALLVSIAEMGTALGLDDQLIVYDGRSLGQVATLAIPKNDPKAANPAWRKRKLAEQFAPIRRHIQAMPASPPDGELAENVRIPDVLNEIGRNLIPSLPDKKAAVLVIGSALYFDRRDGRWSMTERYYPSDGHLKSPPSETPFGVAGMETRLAGATVHYCWPGGEFATSDHEEDVRRWWSLWTLTQGARVGTFSFDPAACFKRLRTNESSGQASYQASPDAKREMLRSHAPISAILPASQAQPGEYFLHDHVSISRTPPSTTKGIAWVGIKWTAPVDLDIYSRSDSTKPWLFFANVQTADGRFNKDHRSATGDKQFEFIEYVTPIDLTRAEVFINFYAGQLTAPPEGLLRVWFDGRTYEAPFKIAATQGNRGAPPMTGPAWVRIDLRRVVGLTGP
jgi:hypothetical protein